MSAVSNETVSASTVSHANNGVQGSIPPAQREATQRRGLKRVAIIGVVFALVLAGFLIRQVMTAGEQSTDDAMVEADVVPVSVRVSGQVLHLRVQENAQVKKGDVIAELDPAELVARLQQAEGELAAAQAQAQTAEAEEHVVDASARGGLSSARAQVTTAKAQLGSASVQIEASRAQRLRAQVDASKAAADYERAKALHGTGAVAQEAVDDARAAADAANAALAAASAQLNVSEESLHVATSRVAEAGGTFDANAPVDAKMAVARGNAEIARAHVLSAKASVDLARVMLSYATVSAPADGIVSRITLHEGQLVSAGQAVASLVPSSTYVIANYKETQVGQMKPGQKVDVEVDALPGEHFHGVVESIAGATGARFSLLPADNASGNFVKVVQRVPVRIRWESQPLPAALRAGMSVVALVHTE
jgi:membrane fusion protein (multidrug efflux system)